MGLVCVQYIFPSAAIWELTRYDKNSDMHAQSLIVGHAHMNEFLLLVGYFEYTI